MIGGFKMKYLLFLLTFINVFSIADENSKLILKKDSLTLSWNTLPNTLTGCLLTAGVYLNGKYYQICGCCGIGQTYKYAQIFNGVSWSQSQAQHPVGISDFSAAVWNNKIITTGGISYIPPTMTYDYTTVFDPAASTWVQSTPMPQSGICDASMASANGKCYLFGGGTGMLTLNTTYSWIPGVASMVQMANMPGARYCMSCSRFGNKIYLFGGYDGGMIRRDNIWEYNTISNTWSVKSTALLYPTEGAAAVTIADKIYIIGGDVNGMGETNIVQIYSPNDNTISLGTPILYNACYQAAAGYTSYQANGEYTGQIYVSGGGYSYAPYSSANIGTVTGTVPPYVQPASLGQIKANYK